MKKWIVSDFREPEEVDVIQGENGLVYYCYDEEDGYYEKAECDAHFFPTREEAQAYWDKEIKPLFCYRIKKFIGHCILNDLYYMIPDRVKHRLKKVDKRYFDYTEKETIRRALGGRICIEATTFDKEEVKRVEYGKEYKVILRDDKVLTTSSEVERFIIESIFGENTSGREFEEF